MNPVVSATGKNGGHEGQEVTRPVLAADVGGTQMRAALVDETGRVLLRRSVATPAEADVPASLTDLIASVAAERGHGAVSRAVVGLPGAVDYEAGRLLWAPHLPAQWPDLLSTAGLSEHLGLPVSIANDADLAAVGEAWFGAGAASHAVGYLTISTGIGAGVVHGGRLLRGPRSLAEVGHVVIDWHAWVEGAPSTLEELGSGSGVARLARDAGLGALESREVQAKAAAGEPRAAAIWQRAIAACAAGVANLVMSFYPSTVVIGGGMGRQDEFFGPLRDMVLQRPGHYPADLAIVRSTLGDDAGLSGAAAWGGAISAP
jgi:glucokinase